MNKVFRLLVSKDVAVAASGLTTSTLPDGGIAAFKQDWTQLGAAETIVNSPSINIVQRVVNSSDVKIGNIVSFPVIGVGVTGYKGQKFISGRNQITYVGLHPAGSPKTLATGTGDIVATSGVEYELSVIDQAEKEIRQVPKRYNYPSDSSATQLEIATYFVTAINNDPDSFVSASVIGNGTGTNGLTSATAWGIKLKGKNPKYFFRVGTSEAWNTTPITYDVDNYIGTNTIAQLQEIEDYSQGYQGYLNRIWLPKTITDFIVNQPNSTFTSTSATGTINFTQNSVSVGTTTGDIAGILLQAGDSIWVQGVRYTIDSVTNDGTNTSAFTITEPFVGATVAITASGSAFSSSDFSKEESYNTIVITHDAIFDRAYTDGHATRPQETIIAIPSKLANATALTTIQTCLNAWVATTPNRFTGAGL